MDNYSGNVLNINEIPKISNGRVWYVTLLPLLACYLENFAVNIVLGSLLWIAVIIICPLVCAVDEKHLQSFGISNESLHKVRFFPPMYLYKRSAATRQGNTPFILFIILVLYAFLNNGFVQGLRVNDETFIRSIQSGYVSSLTDYSEINSYNTIGKQIEGFAYEDSVKWKYDQDEDYRYVTAEGKCSYKDKKNQKFEIVFQIDFDGYALKSTEVKSVSISGKELTGDEKDAILYKILIETESDNNSYYVNDTGESNQTEYKKA